ncbi:hypothetical protein FZ103_15910 [Streptomonospora sp. PA3]|uniref:hypothetical protein n=1 Tax=Streptomonospora sp. PA3 TaxID=2607326 RepID=UPI0012DEDD68|nr:hypothetical protein [Streptomonospora sp. PA3]MUL42639.1 hypothetical protein [Streptomonospora sp. PA3]
MGYTVDFFVKSNAGIAQLALECAYAFGSQYCTIDPEGPFFPAYFSNSVGVDGEANVDVFPTDFRAYGEPETYKGTAVEKFDFRIQVEFSRKTLNAVGIDGADDLGYRLYSRFLKCARIERPSVYTVRDGTRISAVFLPSAGNRIVRPPKFNDAPELRSELSIPEVVEFREAQVDLSQYEEAICIMRSRGTSFHIYPLLSDGSRKPAPPEALLELDSETEPLLGEVIAAILWRSATATAGETEFYERNTDNDPLEGDGTDQHFELRLNRGIISVVPIVEESVPPKDSDEPVYSGRLPESHQQLGEIAKTAVQ